MFKDVSRTLSLYWKVVTLKVETDDIAFPSYEGWNFNSGNYLFTTDTK